MSSSSPSLAAFSLDEQRADFEFIPSEVSLWPTGPGPVFRDYWGFFRPFWGDLDRPENQ